MVNFSLSGLFTLKRFLGLRPAEASVSWDRITTSTDENSLRFGLCGKGSLKDLFAACLKNFDGIGQADFLLLNVLSRVEVHVDDGVVHFVDFAIKLVEKSGPVGSQWFYVRVEHGR